MLKSQIFKFFLLLLKVPPKLIYDSINKYGGVAKVFAQKILELVLQN